MQLLECKNKSYTLSNKTLQKSEIIYSRLYEEYKDWDSVAAFMEEFGKERQSYYDRKKADNIAYDEIMKVLPEVNREWLFSFDMKKLRELPVRKKHTPERNRFTHKFNQLEEKLADEGVDYKAQGELIGYLQGRIESLSQELFEISVLLDRIRSSTDNHSDSDD